VEPVCTSESASRCPLLEHIARFGFTDEVALPTVSDEVTCLTGRCDLVNFKDSIDSFCESSITDVYWQISEPKDCLVE
jgi:hypothetical protein